MNKGVYWEYFGEHWLCYNSTAPSLIARFMGPTWGPHGADRNQVGPMWAKWTLQSGMLPAINREVLWWWYYHKTFQVYSRYLGHGLVITSHSLLWNVITYTWSSYPLLKLNSSYPLLLIGRAFYEAASIKHWSWFQVPRTCISDDIQQFTVGCN